MADELKYDGLIIFTDGYAPFPDKPKTRVLWAVCDRDSQSPVSIWQKSNYRES